MIRLSSVYFNLHKKCLSVAKSNEKVRHTNAIALRDVKFHINENGRQKVLKEKRKNVHAFVKGYEFELPSDARFLGLITYNPYKYDSFVFVGSERPVKYGRYVSIVGKEIRLYC